MDELNLLFRPTIEALIEEGYIDADDDDTLQVEQGVEFEPVSIQEGETFEVPEGCEAIPDDCQCFLAGDKDDFVFCVHRNGFWIDPTTSRLDAGRYQYMGDGVVQRIILDSDFVMTLALGFRRTKTPEELGEMTQDDIEDWEQDVDLEEFKPGAVFEIRRYNEGVNQGPPCILEHDGIEQPLREGDVLPSGEYLYIGDGVIQRLG